MKGMFVCRVVNADITDFKILGITDVFVYVRLTTPGLKDYVKLIKSNGMRAHWTLDCFSEDENGNGGVTNERIIAIKNEMRNALLLGFDGVNLDAIRFWKPSIKNISSRCFIISDIVKDLRLTYPRFLMSACVKSEWFGNFLTLDFASRLYGQDYFMLDDWLDFLMPMSYTKLYKKGLWKIINRNYNPAKIKNAMQKNMIHSRIVPILWDDWDVMGDQGKECGDFAYWFWDEIILPSA